MIAYVIVPKAEAIKPENPFESAAARLISPDGIPPADR